MLIVDDKDIPDYDEKRCRICGKNCYVKFKDGEVIKSILCEHIMIHLCRSLGDKPYMARLGYKKRYRKHNNNNKLGHVNTEDKDPLNDYYI